MDEALRCHLALIREEVGAAAISAAGKETALWCLGQLPALYVNFCKTSESRYVDEISRIVQALLKELVNVKKTAPAAEQLATSIPDRFRQLHEQLGLPGLVLKMPQVHSLHSRKGR